MSRFLSGKTASVQGTEYGNDKIVHHAAEPQPKQGRICGLRKGAAVLLAAIILIIIIGVALGAGLGVGLHSSSASTTSAVSTTTGTATALSFSLTYGASATSTASSTSSAGAQSTAVASTTCPGTNGTTYTSSNHTYMIFCENDISAPNQSDLGRVYQPSFSVCIDSCAAESTAQGRSDISAVYWVHHGADVDGTCWCIGNTGVTANRSVIYQPQNNLALIIS